MVLYPRLKDIDPAADFTRLGENAVKVETPASVDYLLVNNFPATLSASGGNERHGGRGAVFERPDRGGQRNV